MLVEKEKRKKKGMCLDFRSPFHIGFDSGIG